MSADLEEAMYDEDPERLKDWIKQGGDPSELGNWALRYAEDNELKTMIEILKKDPRVQNYENFIEAIKNDDMEAVEEYHRQLTGIIDEHNTNYPLLYARNGGFSEIKEFLYEDPRVRLQEKVYDNAFPYKIAELLKEDKVMEDPGTYDLLTKNDEYVEAYNDELKRRKKQGVLDTAIGLRGLQTTTGKLPIHVVEEIINHAYDTRGTLGLSEVIPRIQNIFDYKKK